MNNGSERTDAGLPLKRSAPSEPVDQVDMARVKQIIDELMPILKELPDDPGP